MSFPLDSAGSCFPKSELIKCIETTSLKCPPCHTAAHCEQGLLRVWANNLQHVLQLHFGTAWLPVVTGVFFVLEIVANFVTKSGKLF